jgi:hypothetical protein
VPTWLLKGARNVLRGAQWARDAADRLVGGWGGQGALRPTRHSTGPCSGRPRSHRFRAPPTSGSRPLPPLATPCLVPPQAFSEVLANNETWSAPMDSTYELLGIEPSSINTLDSYLQVWPRPEERSAGGVHPVAPPRRWRSPPFPPPPPPPPSPPSLALTHSPTLPPCIPHPTPPHPQEYFNKILKRLKEVGATSDRTNFYV